MVSKRVVPRLLAEMVVASIGWAFPDKDLDSEIRMLAQFGTSNQRFQEPQPGSTSEKMFLFKRLRYRLTDGTSPTAVQVLPGLQLPSSV
jgi:hypothetical protein